MRIHTSSNINKKGFDMAHQKKFEGVSALSGSERYKYFVRKVSDFQTVWGLYDDGWATAEANNASCIPFWPEAVFAEACATGDWKGYVPRAIPRDVFISRWLSGMQHDRTAVAIFPTPSDKACIVSATMLTSDIEQELQQYE